MPDRCRAFAGCLTSRAFVNQTVDRPSQKIDAVFKLGVPSESSLLVILFVALLASRACRSLIPECLLDAGLL